MVCLLKLQDYFEGYYCLRQCSAMSRWHLKLKLGSKVKKLVTSHTAAGTTARTTSTALIDCSLLLVAFKITVNRF